MQGSHILYSNMNQASMRFAEFDRDGNCHLDFDEFLAMQPKQMRTRFTTAEFRQWFESADVDQSGQLSVNEFFKWCMSSASQVHGGDSLESFFKRYDFDLTGELDALEFSRAAQSMGFTTGAYEVFKDLDKDGSGTVAYTELSQVLTKELPNNTFAKQLLSTMALACNDARNAEANEMIDTSKWVIRGRDSAHVRTELQALLKESQGTVMDLIKLFDDDTDDVITIDQLEFSKTMRNLCGYKGTEDVLTDVFVSMDTDGGGTIGFDELFEFVRGKRHSLDRRTKKELESQMRLVPPQGGQLDDIAWDEEVLRRLITNTMLRCKVSPADLLQRWMNSKSHARGQGPMTIAVVPETIAPSTIGGVHRIRVRGGFAPSTIYNNSERTGKRGITRPVFMDLMQRTFFRSEDLDSRDLWVNEVKPVAEGMFDMMLDLVKGENFFREIGPLHFQRWFGDDGMIRDEDIPWKTKAQRRQQQERRETMLTILRDLDRKNAKQSLENARREAALEKERSARRKSRHGQHSNAPESPPPESPETKLVDLERIKSLAIPRGFGGTVVRNSPASLSAGEAQALRPDRISSAPRDRPRSGRSVAMSIKQSASMEALPRLVDTTEDAGGPWASDKRLRAMSRLEVAKRAQRLSIQGPGQWGMPLRHPQASTVGTRPWTTHSNRGTRWRGARRGPGAGRDVMDFASTGPIVTVVTGTGQLAHGRVVTLHSPAVGMGKEEGLAGTPGIRFSWQ